MNLKTKKILAKEFIFMALLIVISILFFIGTYALNSYNQNKLENTNNEISVKNQLADSLMKPFNNKKIKQEWFFNQLKKKFNIVDNVDSLWNRTAYLVKVDSIQYNWNNKWDKETKDFFKEMEFDNYNMINSFVKANTITNDDVGNYNKSLKVAKEVAELRIEVTRIETKILSKDKQYQIIMWFVSFLFIFLFLIRYFIYMIKWSLKILNEK